MWFYPGRSCSACFFQAKDCKQDTPGDWGANLCSSDFIATAGKKGEIRIKYWDAKAERYRTKSGYVGEDGIEENVAYRLDDNNNFVAQ